MWILLVCLFHGKIRWPQYFVLCLYHIDFCFAFLKKPEILGSLSSLNCILKCLFMHSLMLLHGLLINPTQT